MNLSTLSAYLLQQSSSGSLTLASTDTQLGSELQAFLANAPLKTIVLNTAAGTGVQLNGDTLTINGTSAESWPVQGLLNRTVAMTQVTITMNGNGPTTVAIQATGNLTLGTAPAPVQITSGPDNPGQWNLANSATINNLSPLTLLALPNFGSLPLAIPDNVTIFQDGYSVPAGKITIQYFPQTQNEMTYDFLVDAPQANWAIVPNMFEFAGLSFGGQYFGTSLSLVVETHFTIGSTGVTIGLQANASPNWSAYMVPTTGNTFPGLADLAALIGGSSMQSTVSGGMSNMGFDTGGFDAAISNITVNFNWKTFSLNSLTVISALTIKGIIYHVSFQFPQLVINGWLDPATPIMVDQIFTSFGLDAGTFPSDLEISQIGLFADVTNSNYSLTIVVDDETGWQIGPLALYSLTFMVQYASSAFTGSIGAAISIADVELELEAGYGGPAQGWYFEGGTVQDSGIQLGQLIASLASDFGATVPAAIASMVLDDIRFSYESGTGNFFYQMECKLQFQEVPVQLIPMVAIQNTGTPSAPQYEDLYSGTIIIGSLEFMLLFDKTTTSDLFMATYTHSASQQPIQLYELVQSISPSLAKIIPASLEVDLKDVIFAYYNVTQPVATKKWTIAMDLGITFNLSDIPLIGDVLPADETVGFDNLKVQYSNNAFTKDDATTLNAVLSANAPNAQPLPPDGFPSGVNATAKMRFGTSTSALNLDMTGNASQGPQPPPTTQAPAQQQFSNGLWYSLQRSIGPIYFNRVGVDYTNGVLFFLLDGSFSLAGLTLTLQAAGFGSPINNFDLQFTLQGIGIEYSVPGLTVGGGLLIVDPPTTPGVSFQFDGDATIQVGKFGFSAIGSYAQFEDGQPSLFVFANVQIPIGPIPAFFITGLSAGFGYNRDVLIPGMNQVLDFPLIAVANNDPNMPTDLESVLAIMEGRQAGPSGTKNVWLPPRLNEYWMAFGLQFSTYELLFSNAMVVAKFGKELELALLGVTKMQLPPVGNEIYVFAELMMEVDWKPDSGFFGISAQLSSNSYVLDKNCKLTGGFAFYLWYGGENAGQFVVTLGGYHPQFTPPPFYPSVPRLGINWTLSNLLSINGSAYMALTPSAAMAGGSLAVNFHEGDLKAWFTAEANALITFNPFYFNIDISVSVGVSYKMNLLFTTLNISVSLGASLQLWGPSVGGSIYVDFYILGFTINFGASLKTQPQDPLTWTQFQPLLPQGNENTISINSGLASQLDENTLVVRANQFAFSTNSVIPAQKLTYNGSTQVNGSDYAFDIRPMNLTNVAATQDLQIFYNGSNTPMNLSGWNLSTLTQNMPATLWGPPLMQNGQFILNPTTPSADTISNAPIGMSVAAPPPTLGSSPGPLAVEILEAEPVLPNGVLPISIATVPVSVLQPQPNTTTVALIEGIMGFVKTNRDSIFNTLSSAGIFDGWNGPLDQYAATAGTQFSDVPMKL